MKPQAITGVFAAAITPLRSDFSPDLVVLPSFLGFLAQRGCHGALLLGTTGEGPSFSPEQRRELYRAALEVRQEHPEFCLLAGTGTPSLDETSALTRFAFDLGMDGVVVLPPYYFRKASDDGLYAWYHEVIHQAVPTGGALFGYHFPGMSGVSLSVDLLSRLKDAYTNQFIGIKDSSGDAAFAEQLGARFGHDLLVFTGNDSLFTLALQSKAAGCITALANLISPDLRRIWDSFQSGQPDLKTQEKVDSVRAILERYPPAPPFLKALLARDFGFPRWPVCPPLLPLPAEMEELIASQLFLA
jgi:4-hydroxy-tetrahydrodipicolinate synthase